MRFDDPGYVERWVQRREYPAIHNSIFEAAVNFAAGGVLDLCSSTGLLGRHVRDQLGLEVCAVEGNIAPITIGRDAGIYGDDLPVCELGVETGTLGRLLLWLVDHGVRTVLARRCFPELSETTDFTALQLTLAGAGVERIILEGRIFGANTKHPLGSADAEVQALGPTFTQRWARGDVRVLRCDA